jgi:hypothetical protein
MQRHQAARDYSFNRPCVFIGATARRHELHVDDPDWQATGVIGLHRVRQLKQFLLGGLGRRERAIFLEFHLGCMIAMPTVSAGRFSPLGLRGILVLDLANGISGFAKSNQHGLGEMNTFFVTFRDLIPHRAVPRTRMINESGFDRVCYDDKAVFWHPGFPPAFALKYTTAG